LGAHLWCGAPPGAGGRRRSPAVRALRGDRAVGVVTRVGATRRRGSGDVNPTLTGRTVKAPRGAERSCRGWGQEAAMRMLMNNLDPEVAERPDDLVVYGGTGKAARSWQAFD